MAETKQNKVIEFLVAPTTIITLIGTGVGIMEALMFYNLGQKQGAPLLQKFKGWKMPPKRDLIETVSVVIVTSLLTGIITDMLMKALTPSEPQLSQTKEKPKPIKG